MNSSEMKMAERFFPESERREFTDLVEEAVDVFCDKFNVSPGDEAKLASLYTSMLVHAVWALADMGLDRKNLDDICDSVVNDASVAAEIDEWTWAPKGQA